MSTRRPARLAGAWYPAGKAQLIDLLEAAAQAASSRSTGPGSQGDTREGNFAAALLPHAGLAYSGPCQLSGLAGIQHWRGQTPRVLILTPSHYLPLDSGQLYFDQYEAFETPIGDLAGWQPDCGHPAFNRYPGVFLQEHALELLLPALAWLVPDARIFPIMVAAITDTANLDWLTLALQSLVVQASSAKEPCLVLASSDLSHYGRRFNHHPYGTIENAEVHRLVAERDQAACDLVSLGDGPALLSTQAQLAPTMCGRYPAMLLATLARQHGWSGRLSGYYRSDQADQALPGQWPGDGRTTGFGTDGFVSYAALRFVEDTNHAA